MPTEINIKKGAETLIEHPKLYSVILHNDDYTPMDFVVHLLIKLFYKDEQSAIKIMKGVHDNGIGVAGVYPFDIAFTKKMQSENMASEKGYPLRLTLSAEDVGGNL